MPHACRNVLSVELPLIYTVHGSPPIGPSQATVGRPGLQNMQHTHTQTHTHIHTHTQSLQHADTVEDHLKKIKQGLWLCAASLFANRPAV